MKTSDFDYELPEKFIAQDPCVPRDSCKLFVYDSKNDRVRHQKFSDLKKFVLPGDVLVLNRSKVIPARLTFKIGDKDCEFFLLEKLSPSFYECMVRPGKFFHKSMSGMIGNSLAWEVCDITSDGTRRIKFSSRNKGSDNVDEILEKIGNVPLPPYIKHSRAKFGQYQTIYSKEKGSVAAPTAGLHFTRNLINDLKKHGADFAELILHVGRGTFLPVVVNNLKEHKMHSEKFEISSGVAGKLNDTRSAGHKIIAVGTTSCRVLESSFVDGVGFVANSGETNIFIYPGSHKWKAVDSLITNFHLPKSTLLMLVASFLESKGVKEPVKKILDLYSVAKKNNYRFYSFGDAMLIL